MAFPISNKFLGPLCEIESPKIKKIIFDEIAFTQFVSKVVYKFTVFLPKSINDSTISSPILIIYIFFCSNNRLSLLCYL